MQVQLDNMFLLTIMNTYIMNMTAAVDTSKKDDATTALDEHLIGQTCSESTEPKKRVKKTFWHYEVVPWLFPSIKISMNCCQFTR